MPKDQREALRGIRMTGDAKQKGGGLTREVVTDFTDMTKAQQRRLSEKGYVAGEAPPGTEDLSKLKVDELRRRAVEKGVEGADTMKKADLLAALEDE